MQIVDELSRILTGNEAWFWAILPLAVMAYLAPLVIAFERRHRYAWTIGAINVATGWTLVGWVAALVWAVNKDIRNEVAALPGSESGAMLEPRWSESAIADQTEANGDLKKCPYCAELIKAEAIVCRYCSRDLVLPSAKTQALPATELEAQEKLRLERLLSGEEDTESKDPRLLDVFEYMRLLEENDPPLATNVVPIGGAESGEQPSGDEVSGHDGDDLDPAHGSDWDYPETATSNKRR